jgi:hypothetical protein
MGTVRAKRALALVTMVGIFGSLPVSAVPLRVEAVPESVGGCESMSADVVRWRPGDGPAASFVAERFVAQEYGNVLVLLGGDTSGFWTAETNVPSDACDDCDVLRLVHTSFAGERKSYVVAEKQKLVELDGPARIAHVKKSLFALAAGPWHGSALSQDYHLSFPQNDEGLLRRYTGWFAEVRVAGKPGLRFGVESKSFMCWCSNSWRGYALRG